MPAENRLPDVLRALRDAGPEGGTLAQLAVSAGLAPKTVRKHLASLVESGLAERDRLEVPPFHVFWVSK